MATHTACPVCLQKKLFEAESAFAVEREQNQKLRAAIVRAGFAVMETSGDWSIHDVSERGKAEEERSLEVATRNVELEIEIERLRPKDDGEPIDVGWFRATYGWGDDVDGWIPFGNFEAGYDVGGHIGVRHVCHRGHRLVFGPFKTRGEFRRAAAALGIKEKAVST